MIQAKPETCYILEGYVQLHRATIKVERKKARTSEGM